MTYLKTIILGGLGDAEVWSVGLAWRNFELFPASMTQSMVESLSRRLVANIGAGTWGAALQGLLSSSGEVRGWRVEQHEENEQLVNVGEAYYATAIPGTGTAAKTPQDSVVISLRTDTPGARGRGRIYWPALGAVNNTSFKLTTPTPTAVVTGARSLFNLIGDQINAEWAANSFAVTTELSVRSVTDHVCRKVNRLQVGDVLDTQRRRRDAVPETYSVLTFPS